MLALMIVVSMIQLVTTINVYRKQSIHFVIHFFKADRIIALNHTIQWPPKIAGLETLRFFPVVSSQKKQSVLFSSRKHRRLTSTLEITIAFIVLLKLYYLYLKYLYLIIGMQFDFYYYLLLDVHKMYLFEICFRIFTSSRKHFCSLFS